MQQVSFKKEMSLCDELLPKKICSPPPKPPRRRHSDQSNAFLSGSHLVNRKKTFIGNLSHGPKSTNLVAVSGSESLPSNWVSESPNNILNDERQALNYVEDDSLKIKSFSPVSPQEQDGLGKDCSKNKHVIDVPTFKCSRTLDQFYITEPNFKLSNHFLNKKLSSLQSAELNLDSVNHSVKQVGDSVILHRRHHSDPVISNGSNSFSTVSNGQLKRSIFETPAFNCYLKGPSYTAFVANGHFNSGEIKVLKEVNDKLWQHLCLLQAKLDSLQGSQISSKNDDPEYPSFAELLFDVYKAQKEKDVILQKRLKAALELRDSAIQELEEVLQIVIRNIEGDKSCDDESDKGLKDLDRFFHELETVEHPAEILHHQHILLAYLYHAKERKIQQLSHALRLAEEERDKVIFKAKKLEDEICKIKNSSCIFHADEDAIFEIVNQRDSALAELKSLQAQILSHHTESYHAQIHDLADNNTSNIPVETTAGDIEHLKVELNNLAQLFTNEVKKRQVAEGNCLRLQRMLNFLLEKVNGLNIGVPV